MRLVSYECECGDTGGELPLGPWGRVCLTCGAVVGSFRQKTKRIPDRRLTRCGVDALHVENERWSWSMGCNPEDVPKMMQRFPGSEYNHEGQLRVGSRHDKLKKMKERGLVECDGFKHRNQNKRRR